MDNITHNENDYGTVSYQGEKPPTSHFSQFAIAGALLVLILAAYIVAEIRKHRP
jgi:hypothetical protein